MQIVIDIPEKIYKYVQQIGSISMLDTQQVANAIFDGTPLPKGHGNLIDVSELTPDADYEDGIFGAVSCQQIVEAEAIIEADMAESEGI